VVLAEERPPAPYAPWIDDVPYTYAAAFHLRPGTDWTLAASARTAADPSANATAPAWPNPLNLLRHLTLRTPTWRHANDARCWTWTRTA